MKTRGLPSLIAALALALVPALVSAHAHLVSSSPAAGENLEDAPAEVVITFDDELDPDGSSFTVTDRAGNEVGSGDVDLDVAERSVMRGIVTISDPGVYTVTWVVLAADGHEASGEFQFGFRSDDAPNTSMPNARSEPRGVELLGIALVLFAAIVAGRAVGRPTRS